MKRFKLSGRECGGTKARDKYVMSHRWCADGWPQSFGIEAEEQSVPADGKAIAGCHHETRVAVIGASRGPEKMFRKTAECIVCPYCDFGIETNGTS